MSWFYPVKVNVALASMAVNPSVFAGEWRSNMQQIGKNAGLTPEETALAIVAHGLGINFPMDVENAIGLWRQQGKVDISKPAVIEALQKMGFRV